MTAEAALLTFYGLEKSRADGRRLLDIARLGIPAGSCLLLTGENGAGKTTLLKIIAGLEAPDTAEVEYRGKRLPWHAAQRFYRHDVIYLHQQPYLFDSSVADNIAYGLKRASIAKAEIVRRVEQALEWAGLGALAARNARKLSGGEQQRVALTRAWVLSPRVLLLDEPLASMDHESRERSYFLIQRLKTEGIGVVIASHEFERLAAVADVHLRLDAGTLRADTLRAPKRPLEAAPARIDSSGAAGGRGPRGRSPSAN